MRCLIAERNSSYVRGMVRPFQERHFSIEIVASAEEIERKLEDIGFHVLLLSMDLPRVNSSALVRQLRADGWHLPIIMVSREDRPDDRVAAFEAGADDCVSTSIDPIELIARINNTLRRQHSHGSTVLTIGELEISLNSKSVTCAGQKLSLTGKEYEILEHLALRRGSNVTKDQLVESLYGMSEDRDPGIADVYLYRVRKKLTTALGRPQDYIQTVWGQGIVLNEPKPGATKTERLCA